MDKTYTFFAFLITFFKYRGFLPGDARKSKPISLDGDMFVAGAESFTRKCGVYTQCKSWYNSPNVRCFV